MTAPPPDAPLIRPLHNLLQRLPEASRSDMRLDLSTLSKPEIERLRRCAEQVIGDAHQGISAIGTLLFWAGQHEDDAYADRVVLLLALISDLLESCREVVGACREVLGEKP